MKPSSAKAKGKLLEDYVADQIISKGIDSRARRDSASGAGTREKGDICTSMMILGRNAGIECKNHSSLHIPEWWKQTQKLEVLGREPVLVFKVKGDSLEDAKVVVYLNTFLDLVSSASNDEEIIQEDSQSMKTVKYQAQFIKEAVNKILKTINRE